MSTSIPVRESYRHVRAISRRSGSNFYPSFWLLPKAKRDAMCALYAFARITDDMGDCEEPTLLRTRWLEWWRQTAALNLALPADSETMLAEKLGDDVANWPSDLDRRAREIFPAIRDSASRFQIPERYFLDIVDGVLADQQKTRFDTYEQLEHYCYLVASAVGLACLHIWEFEGDLPTESAIDCGLAFQLTNILRDIAEDADRGRIYLPRQHYEQHGLSEDDLLQPRIDDRLLHLIHDEIERAKSYYVSGWRVWDTLHPDGQRMFSMIWRTYRRLLDRIEKDPRAAATTRIRLTMGDRMGLVSKHFIGPLFRRLPVPPTEVSINQS